MALVHAWFKIPFWQRVAAGFALGALAGWLMGPAAGTWFGPLGTVYVNLIKMIAIPLVFFAVVSAVGPLAGQRSIAALAGRGLRGLASSGGLAVAVGLASGGVLEPGVGVDAAGLPAAENYRQREVPGPLDVLLNIVPESPFRALAALGAGTAADGQRVIVPSNFTILQVIFFAGLAGFALVRLGD